MLATQILTYPFAQSIDTSTRRNTSIEEVHDAAVKIVNNYSIKSSNSLNSQMYSKNIRELATLNRVSSIIIL